MQQSTWALTCSTPSLQLNSEHLHDYQRRAIDFALNKPETMLWVDMGLGKTVIALTAILERINSMEVYGALVVAPKRVCQTVWRQEAQKWCHTAGLTFSLISGNNHQRHRAMRMPADVYLVNYENLIWLVAELSRVFLSKGQYPPFNMIVFDEVSKVKDAGSKRHKAYRQLMPFIPYRMGLTGTPAGNGYRDLHGQFLAIDAGQRLGLTKLEFQQRFQENADTGYFAKPVVRKSAEEHIQKLISDITIQMDAKDYLEVPEEMYVDLWVDLEPEHQLQYEKLETEMFLEMDSCSIEVFNAAALSTKCRQYAQGAMYIRPGELLWVHCHDAKLDALDEVVEEAAGSPLLVAFEYRHDAQRILHRYSEAQWLHSGLGEEAFKHIENEWNAGRVQMLIGHPGSMGHGLNLQYGPCGHLALFGIDWSLDLNQQVVARLVRQNQTQRVIVHRILCRATVEEAMLLRHEGKHTKEESLKAALNEYRARKQLSSHDAKPGGHPQLPGLLPG